jgi:hypothetical protein
MKSPLPLTSEATVAHALAKGVCPVCALVRVFQSELIDRLRPERVSKICNFHAWAIAGSAPATAVAEVFLSALGNQNGFSATNGEVPECDLCNVLRAHEAQRLREFANEMRGTRFADWIEKYGTVCLFHGAELASLLDPEQAELVKKVMKNNERELRDILTIFLTKARQGTHAGAGVLGRVAEFLVAQRGITR